MEKTNDYLACIEKIVKEDDRYEMEAYNFVMMALSYTISMIGEHRHVSGKELLEGTRRYALEQFGPMARTVFEHWGLHRCEDFGEIVFILVEHGLLGKTEHDSKDDFKNGYDFETAFDIPYTDVPSDMLKGDN